MYDYLIVGAGLFGSTFAYEMTQRGKKCLVIDKRGHIGGNIYTKNILGINVHKYGAHIFHTNNRYIWNYMNNFCEFNHYINSPIARYKDEIYNLPFNMNTFYQMWGVKTPKEARDKIQEQVNSLNIQEPKNLEEKILSLVGYDIYEKLIKGYTEKQWGRQCSELPSFIINRLPIRFTFNNNYFNDIYQGIPIGGYTQIIEKMLAKSDVMLNTSYKMLIKENPNITHRILYTGGIDEFFDYQLGYLEYRSIRLENKILNIENYQGNAVVNYTEKEVPYTRVIEHKHFEFGTQENTIVTYEYPSEWEMGKEAYYPINNEKNNTLYKKYLELAKNFPDVIFGGRLGRYQYLDMDKSIELALEAIKLQL